MRASGTHYKDRVVDYEALNLETAVGWRAKQRKASIGGPLRQVSASAEQF